MEIVVWGGMLLIGFIIPFSALIERNLELKEYISELQKENRDLRWKYLAEVSGNAFKSLDCTKNIPKGTVQAVKEAMKRSHPDNGGNAADFQMYRRAYNVLTGKERL